LTLAILANYEELYEWSTTSAQDFWSTAWDFTNIISSSKGDHVLDGSVPMNAIPVWFKDARLNWAENLLWCRSPDKVAIIATGS
jgi:acetoacetyl-CoA synthetase